MVQYLKGRHCITVESEFDVLLEAGITVKGQAAEGNCSVWEEVESRSDSVIYRKFSCGDEQTLFNCGWKFSIKICFTAKWVFVGSIIIKAMTRRWWR